MQDSTSCYQLQKLNLVYLQNWVSLFFMCGKRIYKHFVEKVFQWYTKKSLKLSRLYLILTNSLTIMQLRSHHKTLINPQRHIKIQLNFSNSSNKWSSFEFSIFNYQFSNFCQEEKKISRTLSQPSTPSPSPLNDQNGIKHDKNYLLTVPNYLLRHFLFYTLDKLLLEWNAMILGKEVWSFSWK